MPRPAPDHRTAPPRGDTAGVPRATGWAARRGPAVAGLFRAAFLRTQRAPFDALGSPVTYAVFATGLAWMLAGEFVAFVNTRGGLARLDADVVGAFVATLSGYQVKTVEQK